MSYQDPDDDDRFSPLLIVPGIAPKKKEELLEPIPEPPKPKAPPVDLFITEIKKIKNTASPAERSAIEQSDCFGRGWYVDPADMVEEEIDIGGPCTILECQLRRWCELVYGRATGTADSEPPKRTPRQRLLVAKRKVRGGRLKLTERPSKRKYEGKYDRHPYVDVGRPVDKFGSSLWQLLGEPPELPKNWSFPLPKTGEQKEDSRQLFVEKFGSGVVLTRRMQYHQYFINGVHLMRFWVNAAGGGWLDFNLVLSRIIFKQKKRLDVERTPESGRKTKYRFYPYRTYLSRQKHINRLRDAFAEYEGIKSDNKEPGGGQNGNNSSQN